MADRDSAVLRQGPIGLDFAALKDEGITALQGLCGDLWTDYNLHDPGVTVLEQLVYSLTDLAYRTEFDVADYLTGPSGEIDFDALALYAPQDVFHGQALTENDYRRVLYDAIPSVSEVWVRARGNGLLAIDVAVPSELQTPHGRASVAARVRRQYAAHRNLCEDLAEVAVLQAEPYYLQGYIDLCGERAPAGILAQILFDCRNYIVSGMTVHRVRDMVAEGMPPETVYEGPPTHSGYITVDDAPAQACVVTVSELVGVIQRITGVSRVRSLVFCDSHGAVHDAISCDTRSGRFPCLPFPQDGNRGRLRLQAEHSTAFATHAPQRDPAGVLDRHHAMHAGAEQALRKMQFHRHAFRATGEEDGAPFAVPVGRLRPLAQYWSVQHDFPAVYGVGQYGLPQSAGAERIAQAQQLKGYLFPFEQLMANYLQNLQEIPTLFSAHERGDASYFHQPLTQDAIPGIDALLIHPAGGDARALREQDDFYERKGRVLDYLLALHGDAFPQAALRRFNQYHRDDTERWLLDAKAALLKNLVNLSAARGRAGNYLAAPHDVDGVSVLERRVAILLGLGNGAAQRVPTLPWSGRARDRVGVQSRPRAPGWLAIAPGAYALDTAVLPGDAWTVVPFRAGATLANYALEVDDAGATLHCGIGDAWSAVGHYATRALAIDAARASAVALAAANQAGEQVRIVEHVLLWPQGSMPLAKDFFGARMTVVLPDWTVRCQDGDFRLFVEETVRTHSPAHVYAGFLWLAPDRMAVFDALWDAWRAALRALHADGAHVAYNAAAAGLVAFLGQQKGVR